jgi:hypothetical protein
MSFNAAASTVPLAYTCQEVTMRNAVLGFTVLAVVCSGAAQGNDESAPYSLAPDRPVTGTMIGRPVVTGMRIPFDKSYAELSPEQQSMLKADYANMGASDEPPFPLNGLKAVSEAIAHAEITASVDGELVVQVDVNSSGDATSANVVRSPNARIARIAANTLQREKYKPALCRGQPCAMPFVYHVELSSPR